MTLKCGMQIDFAKSWPAEYSR